MKNHKIKIIAGVVIVILSALAFLYSCDVYEYYGRTSDYEDVNVTSDEYRLVTEKLEKNQEITSEKESTAAFGEDKVQTENGTSEISDDNTTETIEETETTDDEFKSKFEDEPVSGEQQDSALTVTDSSDKEKNSEKKYVKEQITAANGINEKDKYQTDPVPEGKPVPVEPENSLVTDKKLTCTLSVRCDTILNNIEYFDKEKVDILPKDGIIFAEKTVVFYEGESVFNLLMREMKRNKIHMEFVNTPIYNSAYIEGIANIYEFDCGELSGWMYKVNDWFPNYGCSRYQLKEGDKVEWIYTCDLGLDVGGNYSAKNGN